MNRAANLSRRAFLGSIAVGAAGAILAACGDAGYPTAAPREAGQTPGQTPGQPTVTGATPPPAPTMAGAPATSANIPTPREQTVILEQSKVNIFDSFNPYIPNGEQYQYGVNQVCRECMFYANFEQGKIIPWLATKYAYNPDFTQLTLSLDPNARWNDGKPYTADDVLFSFDLLKQSANLNGSSVITKFVEGASAPNPNTVVVTLKQPNPRFHYNFVAGITADVIRVVPKHIWEKQDAGTFKNNPPVYTGPYVLDRTISQQFMYVWKKNPDYWNKANLDPKPQYLIWRQALPADSTTQEFLRGNVDVPSLEYPNQQAIMSSYKNFVQLTFQDPCPRGMWMNQDSPTGLFAKVEGRQAMSYILDREQIAKTIWQPPTTPAKYPWAAWAANDKWKNEDIQRKYDLTFDLTKAGQLLDGLGATKQGEMRVLNGKPLSLRLVTPQEVGKAEYQIAQSFAANAKKVGIEVNVSSIPGTPFTDAYQTGNYDITSHWLCGSAFDPNQLYTKFEERFYKPLGTRTPTNENESRTRIPELDAVITKLNVADPDNPMNKPLFDQGLEAFLKNLPALPVVQTLSPFLFNTSYWTGWPTPENKYNISANWWAQFLFVIGKLQPAGR